MAKGQSKSAKSKAAFGKRRREEEEEEEEDFDVDAVEALKKLVEEAQKSRPKDKKAKKRKTAAEDEPEEASEEDDELSDEERVLRQIKAEKAGQKTTEEEDEDADSGEEDEREDGANDKEKAQKPHNPNKRTPNKPYVNDAPALRAFAEELAIPSFGESLMVSDEVIFEEKIDPEDDKLREARFLEIATRSVNAGRELLDELKISHRRPTDFMADMIKSDDHMARVKRRLLYEQEKMKVVEARKAAQRNKKRSKEVKKKRDEDRSIRKREAQEIAASYRGKNPGLDDDKPNKKAKTGSKPKPKARLNKNKRKSIRGKRK